MNYDEKWMRIALEEAINANNENEVPVGSIIVKNNKIIGRGHNQPISKNDPTAHAEIQAIRNAAKNENNYRLVDSTLYVTLEPCTMCIGAIAHARIKKVVFGASDTKSGAYESNLNFNLKNMKKLNQNIIFTKGVLDEECKRLLDFFFQERR